MWSRRLGVIRRRSRWRCACWWARADYAADMKALEELGVGAVDVRLFGATAQETVDNMRRFRDEVMAQVR